MAGNELEGPRFVTPAVIRSRVILETARALVSSGSEDWPYPQVRVDFRRHGAPLWEARFFASDAPTAFDEVAAGDVQIAIVNPSGILTMAHRGRGPFTRPLPLRTVCVLPSEDRLGLALAGHLGVESLTEIAARRVPLRLSLRGAREGHSIHLVIHEVLAAAGFSLEDIVAWGGLVRYDRGMPYGPNRLGAVIRGEVDAIFDEGIYLWGPQAAAAGMRFLPLEEGVLQRLEGLGLRRAMIRRYPGLPSEVAGVDFGGWPVYTAAATSDFIVTAFCRALEQARDAIPWEGEGPLPLDRMCRDSREGPLDVPLHPAAEAFWRSRGYLAAGSSTAQATG